MKSCKIMRYLIIFLFFLFAPLQGYANKHGNCLLIPQHRYVYIYDDAGVIKDSVRNDTINEDYQFISILCVKGKYAKVSTESLQSNVKHLGWIKTSNLGIYVCKSYSDTINLYESPKNNAKVKSYIIDPIWGDFYFVLDCYDKWLYVKKGECEGWLKEENQCCNPYSACN